VEAWLHHLAARGLAPATCNRILAVLKSVCSLAVTHGILPPGQSPCAGVPSFKVHAQRERYLAPDEAGRLMRALEESPRPEAAALRLLLLTGARKSEILTARWENVRLDQRLLTVPLSKSNKPRYIPLSDEAVAVIRSIRREPGCPWLFPGHAPGKPLSDIYLFWNELRRRLGLADVRVHDLRHTFASILVNAGHSLYEVQKLLGHSDPRTTMRYAHLGQASLVAAAQTVSACLARRDGKSGGKPPMPPPSETYGGNGRASPPAAW
jgi:integrase